MAETKASKCVKCGAVTRINKFASHAKALCAKHKGEDVTGMVLAGSHTPSTRVAAGSPQVLKSLDEVAIRSNAREFSISVIKLRDKIKTLNVKVGSVVATALDQANLDDLGGDPKNMDIRVNGQKASLLQVLRENDTIYIATKVAGA